MIWEFHNFNTNVLNIDIVQVVYYYFFIFKFLIDLVWLKNLPALGHFRFAKRVLL